MDPNIPSLVTVTLYAALPRGQTASIAGYDDTQRSAGAVALKSKNISIIPGSETYTAYNAFQLFSAKAQILVPTLQELALIGKGAFVKAQLRYGLTVTTNEGQREHVLSNLNVYPPGSSELAWKDPTVSIVAPLLGAQILTNAAVDLVATVVNPNAESLKMGWFVSKGLVSNRRSSEASWTLKEAGDQTVVIVVHGKQSRGFGFHIVDVVSQ
jgi:hypothetical protein